MSMIRQEKDLTSPLPVHQFVTAEEHTWSLSIKKEYPKISDQLKKNIVYFSE